MLLRIRRVGVISRALGLLCGLVLASQPSQRAWAWGAEGHRTVALIADKHLNAATRAQVAMPLQANGAATIAKVTAHAGEFQDLVDMATWADTYRFSHKETEPW